MAIILKEVGPNKVKVVRICRELTGMSLKDAKDAVDFAPSVLEVQDDRAAIKALEEVGAVAVYNGKPQVRPSASYVEKYIGDYEESTAQNEASEGESTKEVYRTVPEVAKETFNETEQTVEDGRKEENRGETELSLNQDSEFCMVDPDSVSSLDRRSLLTVLDNIKEITLKIDNYYDQIVECSNDIDKAKKHAESIRNEVSRWVYITSIIITIALCIIFSCFMAYLGPIVGIPCGILIHKNLIKSIDKMKNQKNRDARADKYLSDNLPQLQAKIAEANEGIAAVDASPEGNWAVDIVGSDLFNSESISELIEIVRSRRADTLKEALNKYDSEKHTNRMEEIQRAIQNASELAAIESVKQTAYAKETAESTHQAATAAKATAYHTRRMSRKYGKR